MHKFSKDDIPQDWHALLGDYFETAQWDQLQKNLQAELDLHSEHIRPEPEYFFKALQLTPLDSVRVVIIGQDPYHSPGLWGRRRFPIGQHRRPRQHSARQLP